MRHIAHGLHQPFITHVLHFVQHQRQYNRRGKAEQEVEQAQNDSISERTSKIHAVEKVYKVFKPDPFASENTFRKRIILKRNGQPEHRDVAENDHEQHDRKDHPIQQSVWAVVGGEQFPFHAFHSSGLIRRTIDQLLIRPAQTQTGRTGNPVRPARFTLQGLRESF